MDEYMIYKFKQPQGEIFTEFFLPDRSILDKFKRLERLADLRTTGCICCGFVRVDEETYLNARLKETVDDYCHNERERERVLYEYQVEKSMTSKVFFDTMRLIDDYKWTCLQIIQQQVRRLLRKGLDVWSEIAIQLYDGINGTNSLLV